MQRLAHRLANLFAILGGLVLVALILLTCLSILGRYLNGVLHSDFMQASAPDLASALLATGIGPINGDFEIVEAGIAFAIFAFIPICQLQGSHAAVDVFTSKLPARANAVLDRVFHALFAAVLVLIAVQLFKGLLNKIRTNQVTLLLEFPVWWSYAACAVAAVVAACIALVVVFYGTIAEEAAGEEAS